MASQTLQKFKLVACILSGILRRLAQAFERASKESNRPQETDYTGYTKRADNASHMDALRRTRLGGGGIEEWEVEG